MVATDSSSLQHDVAEQALADDDVGAAAGQLVALDVADEVHRRQLGEPPVRRGEHLAALCRIVPHVEQRDARRGDLRDHARVGAAHDAELHQLERPRSAPSRRRRAPAPADPGRDARPCAGRRSPAPPCAHRAAARTRASAAATAAPVLPAVTIAAQRPRVTKRNATSSDASRLLRTASCGVLVEADHLAGVDDVDVLGVVRRRPRGSAGCAPRRRPARIRCRCAARPPPPPAPPPRAHAVRPSHPPRSPASAASIRGGALAVQVARAARRGAQAALQFGGRQTVLEGLAPVDQQHRDLLGIPGAQLRIGIDVADFELHVGRRRDLLDDRRHLLAEMTIAPGDQGQPNRHVRRLRHGTVGVAKHPVRRMT